MRIYSSYKTPDKSASVEMEYHPEINAVFIEIENTGVTMTGYARISVPLDDFWVLVNGLRNKIMEAWE